MILHIPLFEYQECKFSDLQIPKGVSNPFLDNVFVDGLEKFLQKSGLDNILSFSRSGIKPASHVGVIKYKNIQFEILPKLLAKNENRDQILKNLLYMLSYTKKYFITKTF
jgi:5-methylcytosine-specific restriction endonuclease McrBC regulatory subunit McrC